MIGDRLSHGVYSLRTQPGDGEVSASAIAVRACKSAIGGWSPTTLKETLVKIGAATVSIAPALWGGR